MLAEPNGSISVEPDGEYYIFSKGTANVLIPRVYSSPTINVNRKWYTRLELALTLAVLVLCFALYIKGFKPYFFCIR